MCFHVLPEKFVRASLLLLVSAMARRNCSRMVLSSDERCSVLCSATRRRSFKAWNSLWYAISFSVGKGKQSDRCIEGKEHYTRLKLRLKKATELDYKYDGLRANNG